MSRIAATTTAMCLCSLSLLTADGMWAAETSARSHDGWALVSLQTDGAIVEYVLPGLDETALAAGNEEFMLLSVPFTGYTEQVGAPQLPVAKCVLGIPLEGDIEVTVLEEQVEERAGYRVAPVPTLIGDEEGNGAVQRSYIADAQFYAQDSFYPPRSVDMEKPSFLRNQRIAGLLFCPVQFNGATGTLRVYSKITVRVRFEGATVGIAEVARPSQDLFEETYSRVLLNYEAAKVWRRYPARTRAKESFWQGSGDWFKIEVTEDGMYRLDADDLSVAGIDLASLDPRTLRIYNGGGRELPQSLAAARPDSMAQMAIAVEGEEDGSFDKADYVLFFGQSVSGWEYDDESDDYSYFFHHYTDENVYWLTYGGEAQGKRMQSRDGSLSEQDPLIIQAVRSRIHEENEVINPSNSGLDWYWATSSSGETKVFRHSLQAAIADSPCTVTARLKGKTTGTLGTHKVKLYLNDRVLDSATFYNENVLLVRETGRNWVMEGINELQLDHVVSGVSSLDQVFFDWYEIKYWSRLVAQDGALFFSAPRGDRIGEFKISGFAGGSPVVYDITDPFNVALIRNPSQGEILRFQNGQDPAVEQRYAVIDRARALRSAALVKAAAPELRGSAHGADYLIITHEGFLAEVEPLRLYRQSANGFDVRVVATSSIYDEFAWGLFDPAAIRDFLKYARDYWEPQPAYVVFVGDGNYDYRNHSLTSPGNWVPPYEQGSIAYDDWFVYLDGDGTPDMYIGRLPAQSRQQVQDMVEKIQNYEAQPLLGSWRNRAVLLADDEWIGCRYNHADDSWNTVHTQDSETLSRYSIPRQFKQRKIYLTEYELDPSCYKPEATDALIATLNEGISLFNYIGHGGYEVMAQERAFYAPRDLPRLRNERMLFFLAAFTCDLGVYDRPRDESMAEDLVRMEEKGAIATIAASRGTSSGPNLDLSQKFYANLFSPGAGLRTASSIGEALLRAKSSVSTQSTARLYLLFGDPAQRLSLPKHEVIITRVEPDTLQALRLLTVEGKLVDQDGAILQNFEGSAQMDVYDSYKEIAHSTPDGRKTIRYQLPGALLYRGVIRVSGGSLATQFVIPKDITYGGTTGRIHVYVSDGETIDGCGYRDSLVTAGGGLAGVDSVGPSITMTIAGREDSFAGGDYVNSSDTLSIALFDSSGINITGETGHWIVLQMDDDLGSRINLTGLFSYDEGSHQQGSIRFPLSDLADGPHTLEVIAWDNHNNASVHSLSLRMVADDKFEILNVMNYPNPFARETTFTYELTGPARDVHIRVYTVAGRLIRTLHDLPGQLGFNQAPWDAEDEDGDRLANGVYLYKVEATDSGGKRREHIGRLVVMK